MKNIISMTMIRTALLGSVSICMMQATPAQAQLHPKPSFDQTICEEIDLEEFGANLIPDGAPSQLRAPRFEEVGGLEYDENNPLVTCGQGVSKQMLKCVNALDSNKPISSEKCDANARWAYEGLYGNRVKSEGSGPGMTFWAVASKELGACTSDRKYAWVTTSPSMAGVCGTQTVSLQVQCMDITNPESKYETADSNCAAVPKPATTKEVTSSEGCGYDYAVGSWSVAAPSCGQVQETRSVTCQAPDGSPATDGQCATYLTPTEEQAAAGMPISQFWSGGAVYWPEIGSPVQQGNYLTIYKMPVACDKGDLTAIQAECTYSFRRTSQGYQLTYIKPKATRFINDTRACTSLPAENPSDYGSYHWNTPTYVPDQTGVCGPNTKSARVFCIQNDTGTEVSSELCDPTTKPLDKVTFEDASGCVAPPPTPAPTPTPTPEPEVVPVPVQEPAYGPPVEIELGACGYTSSGNSRYACGQTFRQGSNPAPWPHEICSGKIIAGTETDFSTQYQTSNTGPNWKIKPTLQNVPGARCVVHYRAYGYSNDVRQGWESVYFDGPATGVAGGLFISKKP